MENFANFNSEWIIKNGRRWEKDGKIRYYFNSIKPVFDLLGIAYKTYKTGNFCHVDGYSNNTAWKMNMAFSGSFFDAIEGKFMCNLPIIKELEKALEN